MSEISEQTVKLTEAGETRTISAKDLLAIQEAIVGDKSKMLKCVAEGEYKILTHELG